MEPKKEPEQLFYEEIQACDRCDLCKVPINVRKGKTPGAGFGDARIVVIGLASGYYRDKAVYGGTPFNLFCRELNNGKGMKVASRVRKALEEMLEISGIEKKDIYITNLLKCSTLEDRAPTNEEIAACFDWLNKEIELVKPEMLICLGQRVSSYFHLKPIQSQKQGQTIIIASYHPAYAVYSGNSKFFIALKKEIEKYKFKER